MLVVCEVCEVCDDALRRDRALQQDTSELVQFATLLRERTCNVDAAGPGQ
jgi:hypothetical protein